MVDLSTKTDQQIGNLISNHEREGATDRPLYRAALAERARRVAPGVDMRKSVEAIFRAARQRRFLAYKDLSDASGAEWSRVRYSINTQLGDIVTLAHGNDWPLLSAIVVNKQNSDTGKMEAQTLAGFVNIAQSLGYSVTDGEAFLRSQQEAVFDWAAKYPAGVLPELR